MISLSDLSVQSHFSKMSVNVCVVRNMKRDTECSCIECKARDGEAKKTCR